MAFEIKQKEPILSQNMQNIISRSHQDGGEFAYDAIESYKYKIMKLLTQNQDLLWTLHNKDFENKFYYLKNDKGELEKDENGNQIKMLNGDYYRDINIYNFLKIPGTQSKVKNFVCFEVNDDEQARYNEALIIKNILSS